MLTLPFPWIALFVAGGLALFQAALPGLPLLTRLMMNEFGFILCLIAVGLGLRQLRGAESGTRLWIPIGACAALAVAFGYLGIQLWPAGGSAG